MGMDKQVDVVNVSDASEPVPMRDQKKLVRSQTSTSIPDSSIPLKKLVYALLAISLGTVIEWYDFTGAATLHKLIAPLSCSGVGRQGRGCGVGCLANVPLGQLRRPVLCFMLWSSCGAPSSRYVSWLTPSGCPALSCLVVFACSAFLSHHKRAEDC